MYAFNQNSYFPNYNTNYSPTDERIWVQNQTSAEAYLVAPNSFVRLWDSSQNRFYEKRADASGRPYPIEVYEYSRITPNNSVSDMSSNIDYTDEIKALNDRISALEKEIKNVSESYANDTSVQSVQKELHRESRGRSEKADFYREDEPRPAEPASRHGYRISEDDEQF